MLMKNLYIDFNEMLENDLYLLSTDDFKTDINHELVKLEEGMVINVYMDDIDENGDSDNLVATGTVEINISDGWGKHVKWCIRIDKNGIRHQSDLLS